MIAGAMPDEPWLQRAEGYVSALWKDMVTPSGLPVVTWNKESFDAVAGFLDETLGISRTWVKDMVTFTATEFVGAVLGALALVLSWNKADVRRFSEIVGTLGLYRACWRESVLAHGHDCRAREMLSRSQTWGRTQEGRERWRPWNGRNNGVARRFSPHARSRVGDIDAGRGELSRGSEALRQGRAQG